LAGHGADIFRLNFSWGDLDEKATWIEMIRTAEKSCGRKALIIVDVPGPRVQQGSTHTYTSGDAEIPTERDKEDIRFGVLHDVDYIALSFVGSGADITRARDFIAEC